MNADLGELLREGIERATAGERLRPGLAGRARRHHRQRALTVRAAAAATAAAVLPATMGAGGSPQPGAETTAYIVGHTERALAAAEQGSLIERVTATLPGMLARVGAVAVVTPSPRKATPAARKRDTRFLSSLPIVRTTSWSCRGRARIEGFAPGGRLAIDLGPAAATRPGGPQPARGIVAVDPNAGTWYHPLHMAFTFGAGRPTCGNQGLDWTAAGGGHLTPAEWTALISKALSCRLFQAAGHQQVGGVDALRLTATPRLLRELHGVAADIGPKVTLWVNPKTFLPVRLALSPQERADFGWLKPTAANLAALRVTVPAGLHQVRLPAHATLMWAVLRARR
jgi:hypothetical protein